MEAQQKQLQQYKLYLMKTIQLRNYQEGLTTTSAKDIINQVIDFSGTGSITTSEQRKRMKLLDLLEPQYESGTLSLEDADAKYLSDLIEDMKWGVSNKLVRDFIKDFS